MDLDGEKFYFLVEKSLLRMKLWRAGVKSCTFFASPECLGATTLKWLNSRELSLVDFMSGC